MESKTQEEHKCPYCGGELKQTGHSIGWLHAICSECGVCEACEEGDV